MIGQSGMRFKRHWEEMKGAKKADAAEAQHNSAGGGGGKHLGIVGAALCSDTYMIRLCVL